MQYRSLNRMIGLGIGLVLLVLIGFPQPRVSYASQCPRIPPWKYHAKITFANHPDNPFTVSDGNYALGNVIRPVITNATNHPLFLIPTEIITNGVTLEQMTQHTNTIKLINNKIYNINYQTKQWIQIGHYPYDISYIFLLSMRSLPQLSDCPLEQLLIDPNFPPLPIHDILTVVYDEQVVEILGTIEYLENPNYLTEINDYNQERNASIERNENIEKVIYLIVTVVVCSGVFIIGFIFNIIFNVARKLKN